MKSSDRFLIVIIIGIVLLAAGALAVTLTRPEPTYQSEDTPEGVAHNYLLALLKEDFSLAYSYLSHNLNSYPLDTETFAEEVSRYSRSLRYGTETALSVESARVVGSRTIVRVRESHFRSGGLFESRQWTSFFEMDLRLESGSWKVVDSDNYFARCWAQADGCK